MDFCPSGLIIVQQYICIHSKIELNGEELEEHWYQTVLKLFLNSHSSQQEQMNAVEIMCRLMQFKRAKVHDEVCTHDWLEQMRNFIQYGCQIFCWKSFPLLIG